MQNKQDADIFCKISSGEVQSAKIWEDKSFMAFLDLNPNTLGMTLVIPKKHHHSYSFDMPEKDYVNLMLAAKKVAKLLEKGLGVKRVAMVMEGLGVNHVHIKLYPLHGLDAKFREVVSHKKVFYPKYTGFISTQLGPTAEMSKLKRLASKIRGKKK